MVGRSFWILCAAVFVCGCTEYDINTPDTRANRAGFERHLKISPSESVSQIYYYADEMGADVSYQLSFKCDLETINEIVTLLSLTQAPPAYSMLAPRDDLSWWKPNSTEDRTHWIREGANDYFRELWYSETDQLAFYHEYSL